MRRLVCVYTHSFANVTWVGVGSHVSPSCTVKSSRACQSTAASTVACSVTASIATSSSFSGVSGVSSKCSGGGSVGGAAAFDIGVTNEADTGSRATEPMSAASLDATVRDGDCGAVVCANKPRRPKWV